MTVEATSGAAPAAGAAPIARPAPESVLAKVRADADAWAGSWGRRRTVGLWLRLLLLEPGFQFAFLLRAQEIAARAPGVGVILRRLIWYWRTRSFGADIDPDALIGGGVRFPHPYGVVIGGGCKVGSDVVILHNVTLGRLRTGVPAGPSIGNGVKLNAGAVVVGDISIGDGAVIGANAVVLSDVPAGHVAVGVPAVSRPIKPASPG